MAEMKPKPCRCEVYKFPHRKDGGKCCQETRQEPDEESADKWISNMLRNPARRTQEWAR